MKKNSKNKAILSEIATRLGMQDEPLITIQPKSLVSKETKYELVNNHKRFVKGILKLPLAEQDRRIKLLLEKMDEFEAEQARNAAIDAAKAAAAAAAKSEE
jgi:hypothetical protein